MSRYFGCVSGRRIAGVAAVAEGIIGDHGNKLVCMSPFAINARRDGFNGVSERL